MRHAESENGIAGVSGSVPTSPLTSRGHRQADDAAQLLRSEPINAIYSSTALRARRTASHLARRLRNSQIEAMSELTEVHIGSHEGAKAQHDRQAGGSGAPCMDRRGAARTPSL
ncbi:histidine phosphatase family protein [Microlunatus sp. Gsoil 973]|uniref:histidine phosphatase family protein n=1 Tax=Microlunatus sp. Gsoil 973 TaxID=2672569 RepID=UPI00351B3496